MKKQQKEFARAFVLRIALGLALTSLSAILLAVSFNAAPAGSSSQQQANPKTAASVTVVHSYHNDVSPPLRLMQPAPVKPKECELKEHPTSGNVATQGH